MGAVTGARSMDIVTICSTQWSARAIRLLAGSIDFPRWREGFDAPRWRTRIVAMAASYVEIDPEAILVRRPVETSRRHIVDTKRLRTWCGLLLSETACAAPSMRRPMIAAVRPAWVGSERTSFAVPSWIDASLSRLRPLERGCAGSRNHDGLTRALCERCAVSGLSYRFIDSSHGQDSWRHRDWQAPAEGRSGGRWPIQSPVGLNRGPRVRQPVPHRKCRGGFHTETP